MTMKWIEQQREYKRYQKRIAALPPTYQAAAAALMRYITHLGAMDDGDNILTMLDDLAVLFEQGAADDRPIKEIVGDDPVEFAEDFLRNYPAGSWIARERERLRMAIADAAG